MLPTFYKLGSILVSACGCVRPNVRVKVLKSRVGNSGYKMAYPYLVRILSLWNYAPLKNWIF